VLAKKLLVPVLLTALATAVLVGCEGSDSNQPERSAFTLRLAGMNPHIGQLFWMRVVHVDSQNEIARISVNPVATPIFDVTIPDILVEGERYQIDFWADMNNNRRYNAPPVDHAWRRFIGPVAAGDVTLNFMHDALWVDIRWPPAP